MISSRFPSIRRFRIACFGGSRRPVVARRFSPNPSHAATVARFDTRHVTTSARSGPRCGQVYRPPMRQIHARGKKTRATVRLDELPQGVIAADPLPLEETEPVYPTVLQQARSNIDKFDGCVLLTRVGGFYELYFEQADEYGPLLNLKVARKKTGAGPVSMSGFPFFQLDRFLKILVQDLNRHVAIAEEFPNDPSQKVRSGGLLHDRRVARIVTPGTLIDENFMDPYVNNYIMAIHLPPGTGNGSSVAEQEPNPTVSADDKTIIDASRNIGIAWLDLSTGAFFTQPTTPEALGSVLSRVSPREIVLDKELELQQDPAVMSAFEEEKYLITYTPPGEFEKLSDWGPMLESDIHVELAASFTDNEVRAGNLLLHYIKDRLRGLSMKLQPPLRHEALQVMSIDKNSMRSLEIKQTIRDSTFRGSLLYAIRRTVTKSGARLLSEWLSAPSTSMPVINFRQELVSRFISDEDLRDTITVLLRRSHDSHRLVQKFALNRGDPDDLLALASTIRATEGIVNLLNSALSRLQRQQEEGCLSVMIDRISLEEPLKLAQRIRDAIDEEGLVQKHEMEDNEADKTMTLAQEVVKTEGGEEDTVILPKGAVTKTEKRKGRIVSIKEHYGEDNEVWIMKPGASPTLSRLHTELSALMSDKAQLTETLRARLNTASLTLRWTPGLGHICHVKGKDARSTPSTASDETSSPIRTLSSSRTTRSFHQPEWTTLGERIDKTRFAIRAEEQRVFAALRAHVIQTLVKLRRNATVLDELDITTSFARLAVSENLVRPLLRPFSSPPSTIVIGGRHPTVAPSLTIQGRTFQQNDCLVGAPGHGRLWLVTGPNMAGKSTFLRQNALITILAQIGCYVPATFAELSLVDAIFSRVGSADNLYHNQSTFMVEMLETAAILRQATARSFVIMDEVGRGTTPEDGTAVAFAALHHLVHVNKCRVLFATHFHAIADLAEKGGMRVEDGGENGAVEMYCTDVEEDEAGGFVYVHKLKKGINRQSHALKVAKLAGLPEQAIWVAKDVLKGSGVEISGAQRTATSK